MKAKALTVIAACVVLFLLGGFILDRIVEAHQKMKPYPVQDDDWDYWSDPGVLCPAEISDNVGIGTASPEHKLHIVGDVKVEGASDVGLGIQSGLGCCAGLYLFSSGVGGNTWRISRDGGTADFTIEESFPYPPFIGAALGIKAGTGKVGIGRTGAQKMLDISPPQGGYTDLGIQLNPNNGGFVGGTSWMIDNTGDFLIHESFPYPPFTGGILEIEHLSGNVGIGTEEPENKLHVTGAVNLDPIDEPAAPTTGFVLYVDSSDGKLKAKSNGGAVTVLANP
jgi:hypothetical protein